MINQLVRTQIRNMQEINWGDIPDDNPYRLLWGENLQTLAIYKNALSKEIEKINLYPSATKFRLRQKIATYNNLKPENIVITNGSGDALELISKVFINVEDEVVIPSPTFPYYEVDSQMMGAKIVSVKLEKDFSLNETKLLNAVTAKTKIIWIANPNNPTGNILLTKEQIKNIAKQINCLLVIDECYFELTQVTAAQLVKENPNIIVTRSFSKIFALAGARLGYIIANEEVTLFLNRLQQTNQVFSINRFAYAAGLAIMNDPALIEKSINKFKELKQSFEKLLQASDLTVLPTQTTFCLIKLSKPMTGKGLKEKLEQQGIFIKNCSIYPDLGEQFVYLSIPQKQYQKKCIDQIKKALEELSC